MAILIFPLALVLGWFIRSPALAAALTATVGITALVVLLILGSAGTEISPLEVLVLVVGTPPGAFIAFRLAGWRVSRREAG